ncbi:MAG: hypothetical protein ACRDK3_07170 [Actinomycetota bacterium]
MLSSTTAAVHALIVALLGFSLGYFIVGAAVGARPVPRLTRLALAVPALVVCSFALMLAHMASGGLVLSNVWLVRTTLLVVAAVAITLRLRTRRSDSAAVKLSRSDSVCTTALIVLALVLWWVPVSGVLPLHLVPDTNLHMGWASQLMNGESTPSTVVTGDVPNYYPWLYHAVIATLASFVPGETAFHALGPLQALLVVGMTLALIALGRQITSRMTTGVAAAFFGALSGGFGIGLLFDGDLVARIPDMPALRIPFLAEMLSRRPHNFAFNNLAPPYPRDLSFVLLVVFLLLLVIGLQRNSRASLAGAGTALGLVGLAGGEALLVASGVALISCLVTRERGRLKRLAYVTLPAAAVYATWLVPVVVNYLRLDGFVNTTHIPAVVLEPAFFLLSWGIAIPFAVVGAWCMLFRFVEDPAMRVPLALIPTASAFMLSDAITGLLGDAFLTLGRDHRYWSLFHLGVALVAGVGATEIWARAWKWRSPAIVGAALLIVTGCLAPLYGSLAYTGVEPPDELLGDTLRGETTILSAMAPSPGARCVAAVAGNGLARRTFAYTGFRLVLWVAGQTDRNWARIRWTELARTVSRDEERLRDNATLTQGLAGEDEWSRLVEKYGVNLVVTRSRFADSPVFEELERERFTAGDQSLTLVTVSPCNE